MRCKKTINYPKKVNQLFETATDLCKPFIEECEYRLINLITRTGFPKGTRFQILDLVATKDMKLNGVMFSILLPSGEIFSGMAIRKDGDAFDMILPPFIAAGRAIKVYKAHSVRCKPPIRSWAIEEKYRHWENTRNKDLNLGNQLIKQSKQGG